MAVVGALWTVHLTATAANGWGLPEATRETFGASASTLLPRLYAQFTAPFFHESLGHLGYNSMLFAVGLPLALRRLGIRRGLLVAYASSPVAGILVDALVILPLAAAGVPVAEAAAPRRLVGASVVAFCALGIAFGGWRSPRGRATAAAAIGAYELALAAAGVTQPFVFAYHLTGFAFGLAAGHSATRGSSEDGHRWADARR